MAVLTFEYMAVLSKCEYYENLADRVKNILFGEYYETYYETPDPTQRSKYKAEEKEIALLSKLHLHPTRAPYDMTFPVYTTTWPWTVESTSKEEQYERIQPVSLASIRNLSNVSCQIRQELGICAWARSFLAVGNRYVEALECLKERPAIWKGIKTLSFRIQDAFPTNLGAPDGLLSLLEFMEQHLQLDLLVFYFTYPEDAVEELLRGPVKLDWIDAIRRLTCVKAVQIDAFLDANADWDENTYDWDWDARQIAGLEELLTPSILKGTDKTLPVEESIWRGWDCSTRLCGSDERLQADGSFKMLEGGKFQFESHPFMSDEALQAREEQEERDLGLA